MGKQAHLILASASPRRRRLLAEAGYNFGVLAPEVEETLDGSDPAAVAVANALKKARVVAAARPEALVLGADTVVHVNGRLIGKPADREEARRILTVLSGTEQQVVTGVAIVCKDRGLELTGAASTSVRMKALSEREIEAYVASGEGLGKAGAYAIQENGDKFVEEVRGSFSNVVGLPLELVEDLIRIASETMPSDSGSQERDETD